MGETSVSDRICRTYDDRRPLSTHLGYTAGKQSRIARAFSSLSYYDNPATRTQGTPYDATFVVSSMWVFEVSSRITAGAFSRSGIRSNKAHRSAETTGLSPAIFRPQSRSIRAVDVRPPRRPRSADLRAMPPYGKHLRFACSQRPRHMSLFVTICEFKNCETSR
jgi:hypothetical protein